MKTEDLILGNVYEYKEWFYRYSKQWGPDSFKFDKMHGSRSIILTSEQVEESVTEIN
jgi:hypothetical protein